MTVSEYFSGLFGGIKSLLLGMSVTMKEFVAPKVTQQYPENRQTLIIPDRVRGTLTMPHDENNEHQCTGCLICETNCPNGTIHISTKIEYNEEGKKRKVLDQYYYELGRCTFCNLCVLTCPSDAIIFSNNFEGATFTHARLTERLNYEGSKMREKKRPEKPAKPERPAKENAPEVKAEETVKEQPVPEVKPASEPIVKTDDIQPADAKVQEKTEPVVNDTQKDTSSPAEKTGSAEPEEDKK